VEDRRKHVPALPGEPPGPHSWQLSRPPEPGAGSVMGEPLIPSYHQELWEVDQKVSQGKEVTSPLK